MEKRYFSQFKKLAAVVLGTVVPHVAADLIIKDGETLSLNSTPPEILSIETDLVIQNGGLLQGASNSEIRVRGNWDNSAGGDYIHGNSKVFFTGSAVSKIQGNNHFYHLVVNKKDAASGQEFTGSEIQIESDSTQIVSSQLYINGASIDDRLKIRSTTAGVPHTLNAGNALYVEAWFLDVDDSIFIGSIDMPMNLDMSSTAGPVVGSGNNDGWIPNTAPTINLVINNFTEDLTPIVAGTTAAGSYQVEDADNDELTVTFTPNTNANGHYTLDDTEKKIVLTQVAVDRINRGNSLDEINLTVTDGIVWVTSSGTPEISSVNDAPVFNSTAIVVATEDQLYSYTVVASDEETQALTYSASQIPSWLSFDAAGKTLSGTPTNQHVGDHNVVLTVNDGTETVAQTFTVAVANTNDSPIIEVIEQQQILENNLFEHWVITSDEDSSFNFSYSLLQKPQGMTIDSTTGVIRWTPDDAVASGDVLVTVQVDDGSGANNATASRSFTISVTAENDLPVGEVIISGIVAQGQTLTASHNLTDADGIGPISYQWQADSFDIITATQTSYQLSQSDVIRVIRVVASYTDALGTVESVVSNTSMQLLNVALNQLAHNTSHNTSGEFIQAGIANITEENIASINSALLKQGVSSQAQVQQLVDSYMLILNFATNNTATANPPLIGDYANIGITGLSQDSSELSLLSDVIAVASTADIDRVAKLQTLVDAVLAVMDYAENTTDHVTKSQLDSIGLVGVTEDNLSAVLQVIAQANQQLNQLATVQLLVDRAIASVIIQGFSADPGNHSTPTLENYLSLGLGNINSNNIDKFNGVISLQSASDIDSIDKIIALLATDTDADGVEDIFDQFPSDPMEINDLDADGVGDNSDNCASVANQSQLDIDSDGLGDACDPDEDNDGVLSAEDAFKFNPNYSLDSDNDGMPDAFENSYGFDRNNAADKNSDSDGDGVANIDEFLAGTNPRVNPSPGLPELVIPSDIEVVSTGRTTSVDIGIASAKDGSLRKIEPTASFYGPFKAGRHEITWSATDAQGNRSKAVQVVKILPLVNLTPSSLIAEGGSADIRVILSGDAADYPVEIPFTLSGSAVEDEDYSFDRSTDIFTIEQGREASFTVNIAVDERPENNESIEIVLNKPNNAVLGSVTRRSITIVDGNLPPQITVVVEQGQNTGRVIATDKGNVTLTATVTDPNPKDSHQFNWQIDAQHEAAVVSDKTQDNKRILVIDPAVIEPGVFSVTAIAQDNAETVATTEVKTDIRLMQSAPVLSAENDTDGDGVSDADEGYADSDSDGIVDYMDNIVESNLAPVGDDKTVVLQAPVGTQIVLGETAFSSAESTVMVSKEQIISVFAERNTNSGLADLDKDYSYPYGLFDFTVSGAIPGDSYYLVLPLDAPYVEGQLFRKYMGPQIGWQNFIENAKNALFSAAATDGACPESGSHLFVSGIQAGHSCIQLYIEDGGPNDVDGMANGTVTDPGGIAIYSKQGSAPSANNSIFELDKTTIVTRGERAIATVIAVDTEGTPLEGVDIVANCNQCLGVVIGEFSHKGQGVYSAEVTSSAWLSNGWIEIVVSNEFGSAALEPKQFLVKLKKTGGCSIVSDQPANISLFVLLFLFTLFDYFRRRYH